MSTPTVPGDRVGNQAAGTGGKRRIAAGPGAAAVFSAVLAATACAATPTGNSTQAGLTGSAQQVAAVGQSGDTPPSDAPMTVATASMPPAMKKSNTSSPSAAPSQGHHAKSSGPATGPASSGPETSPAESPAPSVPTTWSAPSAPSTGSATSDPPTGSAPSEPAAGGSSNQTLAVSRSCAAQTTVQWNGSFSCTLAASGGTPPYDYWDVAVNGTDVIAGGALPEGLTTSNSGSPFQTFTFSGKQIQWGTWTITVTVDDSEPGIPQHSASTTFTLDVLEAPASDRLPGT